MTQRELGFLLLSSHLGDPRRHVLTTPQLRELAHRVRSAERIAEDRNLTAEDFLAMGYSRERAQQIMNLFSQTDLLRYYLQKGLQADCLPFTRISEDYPMAVLNRLGYDSPGCIWAKGDLSLLDRPAVSLVGSRDIRRDNLEFAREVGRQAALQGFVLVSGNARGADQAAQRSCLASGGQVISVIADRLDRVTPQENLLYISEDGFDLPFTSQRALSRNRLIHCMGLRVFVAQAGLRQGGTWDGTERNLRHRWSPVYCFDDGSEAVSLLEQQGALSISPDELHHISDLPIQFFGYFDQ